QRERRVARGVSGLDGVPLHRLLHRAPAVQARARAALVPALAHVVGLVHGGAALGLELRQLRSLPQPVDDLVDLQLDDEADLALAGAALLAGLGAVLAPLLQHVARLAAPLARALLH